MRDDETIRAYRITGRVQGVGFRWWTRAEAEALRLRGTVRNGEDGSVEVVAAGDPAALEHFRRRLAEGPPGARVDHVDERPLPDPAPLPARFEIIR
ncbi:MAG TPA: acylphosphatase [Longimicrobiales bacterium]